MSSSLRSPVPDTLFFRGRPGDPRLGEWVVPVETPPEGMKRLVDVVLLGCADDTGVRLNRGRAGASEGPNGIRKHLFKMTPPMDLEWEDKIRLFDLGNVVPGADISETHARVRALSSGVAKRGALLVLLGGGHDFAAPGFLGYLEGLAARESKQAALINVDPHLDVRPLENDLPHSGTPFRQILESDRLSGKRFVEFGARANRNSREAYAYAKGKGTRILTLEALRGSAGSCDKRYRAELTRVATGATIVGATFDMDACESAEGVSAAPVIGFSALEMCQMASAAGRAPKVRYFEFAEVAPPLDPTERSSRIGAEMVFAFLRARAESARTR
jgi:formimidoylglutamase